jgi:hypothetical protein
MLDLAELFVMPKRSKIAYRNRNHTGWWIFCEVEQWVSHRQKKLSKNSRCFVWENTRLIRATSRDHAYKKALKLGALGHPTPTNGGEWRFAGISMLLPVYEKIEDGSEILWNKRGLMTVEQIKKLVKPKSKLSVFNDKENA